MISLQDLVEVTLKDDDSFLLIKETLTRIGIASIREIVSERTNKSTVEKKLTQTCLLLQKQGRYFIVHFKEMFLLDGRESNINEVDIARRNLIAKLLEDWGLVEIVNKEIFEECKAPYVPQVKIIPFREKDDWILIAKYTIGTNKIPRKNNYENKNSGSKTVRKFNR